MRSICVFAGSGTGYNSDYLQYASLLGQRIAEHEIHLIYGGSRLGLMGAIADAALQAGGTVTGIMPAGLLHSERGHQGLSELIRVDSMHERKAMMQEMADAFIALPGGLGTLEELFEVLCWSQIGIHHKPLGLYNVNQYYEPLLQLIQHTVREGFSGSSSLSRLVYSDDPDTLLEQVSQDMPVTSDLRWDPSAWK